MLHHSMKRAAKRVMVTLAAATALAGGLASGSATAAAPPSTQGLNGQQVTVCVQGGHYDINAFIINGFNQNNNYVASPTRLLEGDRGGLRCYTLDGYYWKSTIDVDFWADNGAKLGTRQCYVPPSQVTSDYFTCTFA
ncbi:hypothetical protein [Streptomyces sp. NPDC047070]|uniref:hypothetical protein n=1 Tax=Streptomyces sp. NPDC047070 TaxID=3154923 RepID=UPI0034542D1B